MRGQPGFFDIDDRLKRLSHLGDQLETFRAVSAGIKCEIHYRLMTRCFSWNIFVPHC
jgi:hypothetical protein